MKQGNAEKDFQQQSMAKYLQAVGMPSEIAQRIAQTQNLSSEAEARDTLTPIQAKELQANMGHIISETQMNDLKQKGYFNVDTKTATKLGIPKLEGTRQTADSILPYIHDYDKLEWEKSAAYLASTDKDKTPEYINAVANINKIKDEQRKTMMENETAIGKANNLSDADKTKSTAEPNVKSFNTFSDAGYGYRWDDTQKVYTKVNLPYGLTIQELSTIAPRLSSTPEDLLDKIAKGMWVPNQKQVENLKHKK